MSPQRVGVLISMLVGAPIAVSNPAPARAQVFEGRVIDGGSGAPLLNAMVSVLQYDQALLNVSSDSLGRFRIALPAAGRYTLRVERLGYRMITTEAVAVASNELVELELRLGVHPIELAPLLVASRRPARPPYADYHRRLEAGRRDGVGDFITRADLEAVQLGSVSSYIARLPHVQLWTNPKSKKKHPVLENGCFPVVYRNGVPYVVPSRPRADPSIDDLFLPVDIEGLEIYRGRDIPPEYAAPDVCGVIVAWTRVPERGSNPTRARWIIGGTFILGLLAVAAF